MNTKAHNMAPLKLWFIRFLAFCEYKRLEIIGASPSNPLIFLDFDLKKEKKDQEIHIKKGSFSKNQFF